jgi:hypothetical protein
MNHLPVMIPVVGHHRGGTSATAGLLRILGVYLGENEQLIGEGTDNPKGFYEHAEILKLHEHLSRYVFGNDWNDNQVAPAPHEHPEVGKACRYLIVELLKFREKGLWILVSSISGSVQRRRRSSSWLRSSFVEIGTP